MFPIPQLILDYEIYFGTPPPKDRTSLIQNISKSDILFEIVGLNYRLKPKNKLNIDNSLKTQKSELEHFTKTKKLFDAYFSVFQSKIDKQKNRYPIIFSRQTCIFAIEEILNTPKIKHIKDFEITSTKQWDAILMYLLAVNYEITKISEKAPKIVEENNSFEYLNPQLIPLNEFSVETNPVFNAYKGYKLFKFLEKKPFYKKALEEYFENTYGTKPDQFIYEVLRIYITNNNKNTSHNFYYKVKEQDKKLFKNLSRRFSNKKTFKLLDIRKNPFIKVGSNEFLLADNTFLIEKTYNQFLNDFWFDYIKKLKDNEGNPQITFKNYRSEFGYFFESYIKTTLQETFNEYEYYKIWMFDELKINSPNGKIEIADILLRYNKKILLGQVKSSSIYDDEKFGGDVNALYKNDRNKFFKNFGVNQVVESIKNLHNNINHIDNKFPKLNSHKVFPCIIVNDKALQTPLMAEIFNKRFQELLKETELPPKMIVKKLSLIHMSDLETIQFKLRNKPNMIWKLLEKNHNNKKFTPPFYYLVNEEISNRAIPNHIMEIFKNLIEKYNPKNENGR